MEIIKAFEMYTAAQKRVGRNFMILGFLLAGLGLLLRKLQPKMAMAEGFYWGSFVCGLLILFMGIGYRNFNGGLLKNTIQKYGDNHGQLNISERTRMKKVVTNYRRFQFVFIGIVLASLAIKFAVSNAFYQGICYAVIALFIGILMIEYFSKNSIDRYAIFLSNNSGEKST